MDFVKDIEFDDPIPHSDKNKPTEQSDLVSDAKVVADAARSTVQKEPAKHDNGEIAGAAADIIDAGQSYGKLDESAGAGKYVEKAENYLHEYEASHGSKDKTEGEAEAKKEEGGLAKLAGAFKF